MNPEQINELTNIMNTTKITNQSTMHDTVRNKQFIVGSFQPTIGLSFAANPTVQYSAVQARQECKRLAKLYPGKTFVYVQLQGAEMTVPQPTSVSI